MPNVEKSPKEWERETENCLSLFQDLEEGRIALLRDSLWKVTNIVSSHSVVDDSGSEQERDSMNSLSFKIHCAASGRSVYFVKYV